MDNVQLNLGTRALLWLLKRQARGIIKRTVKHIDEPHERQAIAERIAGLICDKLKAEIQSLLAKLVEAAS